MRFFIIVLALSLFSCDILTTREPERPDTQRKNYLPATTPDILFQNLQSSFKEKVLENYMASFVDDSFSKLTFAFKPSSKSMASFPALAMWDLAAEKQYFNNLIINTEKEIPIILDLQNEVKNTMGDSAVYQFSYILSLTPESDNLKNSYRGNLTFYINLDKRNQWVISRWEDYNLGDNPTWSELKGLLY